MAEQAEPVLRELGLRLDLHAPVESLPLEQRQLVEIARFDTAPTWRFEHVTVPWSLEDVSLGPPAGDIIGVTGLSGLVTAMC